MNCRVMSVFALLFLGIAASPAMAQTADTTATVSVDSSLPAEAVADSEPPVIQYYLDGPRIGATLMPDGSARTQFGWHAENQAAPGTRGPWFLVERIILIGGVERSQFIPTGTVVFGIRTPSSFEFGIGPSLSIGPDAITTAVVLAAGQTLHYGGVRVPLNVALAINQRGSTSTYRLTLITGWAIKQNHHEDSHPSRPYKFGLEK